MIRYRMINVKVKKPFSSEHFFAIFLWNCGYFSGSMVISLEVCYSTKVGFRNLSSLFRWAAERKQEEHNIAMQAKKSALVFVQFFSIFGLDLFVMLREKRQAPFFRLIASVMLKLKAGIETKRIALIRYLMINVEVKKSFASECF